MGPHREANEGPRGASLVPVALEAVKPPLAFRRIQTIDLTAPDANASLVTAIARLLPAADAEDSLPCVGRTRELDRVRELIDRARRGEGEFLLFSGEAGVGKTRMTIEAERMARAAGFLVLRGHCPEAAEAAPALPAPCWSRSSGWRACSWPQTMRQRLGENATELSKLMPELRQRYDDIAPYPTLPPEQERRYLLHGVGEFIARGARTMPLVLVFEDLHWADESTCILLRYLAERLKDEPVLLLGASIATPSWPPAVPSAASCKDLTRERLAEDLRLELAFAARDRRGAGEAVRGQAAGVPGRAGLLRDRGQSLLHRRGDPPPARDRQAASPRPASSRDGDRDRRAPRSPGASS